MTARPLKSSGLSPHGVPAGGRLCPHSVAAYVLPHLSGVYPQVCLPAIPQDLQCDGAANCFPSRKGTKYRPVFSSCQSGMQNLHTFGLDKRLYHDATIGELCHRALGPGGG